MMVSVNHIEVIVPACNEEEHITGCLTALAASMSQLACERREVSCAVTVVLDCCTDRTAALVAEFGAHTVTGSFGRVGSARRAGAADAVARNRRADRTDDALWLANTDADSIVPSTWLTAQVHFADAGHDAVIGTVTPDGLTPEIERRWRQGHLLGEGHTHVHGANLGVRADIYLAAGGFAETPVHEDRDLVDRVKALSNRWVATHKTTVVTSARLNSRVNGGFASYVAALAAADYQGDASCA